MRRKLEKHFLLERAVAPTLEECKFGSPNRYVCKCPKRRQINYERTKKRQADFMIQVRDLLKDQPVLTMKEVQEDSVYKVK